MICKTYDDALLALSWLNSKNPVVIDIETTGLDNRSDTIIGVGLSDGANSVYLVHQSFEAGELHTFISTSEMVRLLQKLHGHKLIAHNAAFDLPFINRYFLVNLLDSLYCDTVLLAHLCDENRFTYGLKELGSDLFGADVKKEQAEMKASIAKNGGKNTDFYMADLELMARYCMQDCVLTYRVYQHFLPKLVNDGLHDFFFHDETMPLYKHVTIPMEQSGVHLDVPLLHTALEDIEKDINLLEAEIQSAIAPHLSLFTEWFLNKEYPPARSGEFAQAYAKLHNLPLPKTKSGSYSLAEKALEGLPDGHEKKVLLGIEYMSKAEVRAVQEQLQSEVGGHMFNLQSRHHLKKLLFDTLKEQPLNRTPTGQPQADEELLNSLRAKYEWVEKLVEYYKLQKIKGTYIERFIEKSRGSRFYPKWKQHGTITGRFSGDLQQLPRKLEEGSASALLIKHTNRIRDFITAAPGTALIDADYESLEPHVFAHISKDPSLLQIFNEKLDFYSTIAIKTENLQGYSADKTQPNYLGKSAKEKRQTAKAYALGLAYGLEDYKLHIELGIEQEEAKKLVNGYWSGFPVLKKVSDHNKQQIMQTGQIKTEVGRIRHMPEAARISDRWGTKILDSLQLWKDYNETPAIYEQMKKHRKTLKKCLNAAINFPTQGLASSIINRAAIAVALQYEEQNLDARIVALVHDEILVESSEEHAELAAEVLQFCMENTYRISLKLTAEPAIGKVYGQIK
jgi:DNA polymerase I-like protein with 3'-5' exonuclease and polymerase domains